MPCPFLQRDTYLVRDVVDVVSFRPVYSVAPAAGSSGSLVVDRLIYNLPNLTGVNTNERVEISIRINQTVIIAPGADFNFTSFEYLLGGEGNFTDIDLRKCVDPPTPAPQLPDTEEVRGPTCAGSASGKAGKRSKNPKSKKAGKRPKRSRSKKASKGSKQSRIASPTHSCESPPSAQPVFHNVPSIKIEDTKSKASKRSAKRRHRMLVEWHDEETVLQQ